MGVTSRTGYETSLPFFMWPKKSRPSNENGPAMCSDCRRGLSSETVLADIFVSWGRRSGVFGFGLVARIARRTLLKLDAVGTRGFLAFGLSGMASSDAREGEGRGKGGGREGEGRERCEGNCGVSRVRGSE
jgi:hypothetical protein